MSSISGDTPVIVLTTPEPEIVVVPTEPVYVTTPLVPNPLTVNQGQPGALPWPVTVISGGGGGGGGVVTIASGSSNINVGNFPTIQEVYVTNQTQTTGSVTVSNVPGNTLAVSGTVQLTNTVLSGVLSGNVFVGNIPGDTLAVSGIVTAASGMLNAHIDNWPTTQSVYVVNQASSAANVAVTNTPSVTIASGTSNVNVGNFPTIQEVYVVNQSSNSANVNVTNASLPVTQSTTPWIVQVQSGLTTAVSGTINGIVSASGLQNVHVDNWPTTQGVFNEGGTVAVSNFPATQATTIASGTSNVNVGNFPTVQEVYVTNSTSSQVTQGTTPWLVTNNPGNTIAISGTVTSASGTHNVHVDNWPTTQGVAVENFPVTQAVTIASGTSNINIGNFPTIAEVYVVNQSSNAANVNVTNTPAVTIASGTSNINIGNFPTVSEVYVVNQASNSANVTVTNTPSVNQGTTPWLVANNPGNTIAVSGTISSIISASGLQNVHVDNWPSVQGVNVEAGTIAVTNFPATQPITIASGTSNVNIGNFPTVQEVFVTNSTSSQVTQGTTPWLVANNPGNTLAISGTVTSASGTQSVHVDNWPTVQGVAVENFPATQAVTIASGTSNINIGNFPTISEVYVVNQSSNSANVNVTNTPSVNQGTTPWLIANNPGQTIAVSGVVTLTNTVLSGVLSGNVLVGNIPGQTVAVSGTMTAASGTFDVHVDNWPTTQGVYVVNQASSAANVAVTNTPSVTIASGTSNINVGNFPTIQEVYVVNQSSNSANVNVTNASIPVTQGTIPWLIANNPGQTIAVSGVINSVISASGLQNVHIDNWPSIQGVNVETGQLAVTNFPATQPVTIASGTSNVNIGNFPTVQEVFVTNATSSTVTQGTTPWLVANNPGQTLAVSGTVTATSGTQNVHVDNWPTVQGVAVENFPVTQAVTIASGTSNINIGNFPTISEVYVVNQSSNSANVNVTNATLAVTQSTSPWTVSGVGTSMVQGNKTNNFATASGTNQLGVLPGVANTAAPTWLEGNQVLESMDLSGNQRVTLGTLIAGENLTTNRLNNEPIYSYQNITTNTTTTVKGSAGTLHAIVVNNTGSSSVVTIYDNTAGSGTKIGTISATVENTFIYDASFGTGLTIVTTGTPDITVMYR